MTADRQRSAGLEDSSKRGAVRHGVPLVMLFGLGWICYCPFASSAPAGAETIGDPTRQLDEIVVTARKRQENSQKVPISIIAVSGRQMELSHTYLLTELVEMIPNMQLQFINPRQTAFSIRGLGNNPASEGLDTSVGLYLDGVYISRPGMLRSDLYDIDQVTVLRGPQGTLFGRNTTAGALSISIRKPERTFRSDVQVSAGNLGLTQVSGAITGPMGRTVSGRVAAFYTGRDGTIENIGTGTDLNNQNSRGARAQLEFQPGEAIDLRLTTDFGHQQENSGAQELINPGLTLADDRARPNDVFARAARFDYSPTFDPFARQVNFDQRQAIETNNVGASLEFNWTFAGHTLTSISAWRRWEYLPSNDSDYLPLDIQHTAGINVWNQQWSEEIRIASPVQRRVDFVAGLFLYGQQLETGTIPGATYGADASQFFSQPTLILPANALAGLTSYTHANVDTKSQAVFGQLVWHVRDKWEVTAGARSNWDSKSGVVSRTRSGGSVLNSADPYFASDSAARNQLVPGDANAVNESSGNTLSGSFSLSYKPINTLMLYGSLAHGVKAAGVNTNIPPVGVDPVIRPEVANNIELGIKSTLLNHRLEIDGDLFYANIENYQTTVRDQLIMTSYIANAQAANTRGAELEVRSLVLAGLQLDLAVAYDKATYTSFHNAPCGTEWSGVATSCDLTGRPVSGAPLWSGAFQVESIQRLTSNLEIVSGLEYSFRSSSYYTSDDSAYSLIHGYGLVNAHMSVGPSSSRWQVSFWTRNVLNKDYITALTPGGVFGAGYTVGVTGDPRTYGATVRMKF